MNREAANGRVVIGAVLAVFVLRLVAWGAAPGDRAHAARLNQTIPTVTPTGATSTPTATKSTPPSPTPVPTAIASGTLSPTPTVTLATASATVTSSPALSPSATSSPVLPSTTPSSALRLATVTPSITLSPASAGPTAPAATSIQLLEGTPSPLASAVAREQAQATETPSAVSTDPGLGGSCLWVGLGLVLIVIGAVLLLRWRRSK